MHAKAKGDTRESELKGLMKKVRYPTYMESGSYGPNSLKILRLVETENEALKAYKAIRKGLNRVSNFNTFLGAIKDIIPEHGVDYIYAGEYIKALRVMRQLGVDYNIGSLERDLYKLYRSLLYQIKMGDNDALEICKWMEEQGLDQLTG